ncbi:hypothetical protein ACH4OY_07445 [Micromonospora rubida]|uniref:Uncharacterized protein n=1 Tax=Micromonospora rubida TaxID=2697657 RepID=A0ABW7SJV4_9ACTN
MGDLLGSLPEPSDWQDIAWVGYYDGDRSLASGFADAGDAVLAAWKSGSRPNDPLLLPLIFNYRHGIELALKQAIRQAIRCVHQSGQDSCAPTISEVEAHLKSRQRHRVGPLAQQLAGILNQLQLTGLPPETLHWLMRLQQLDPSGEAFRYANHLNTDAEAIDVVRLAAFFREAFDVIHGGVLTMLDVHETHLYDMRATG